MLFTAGAEYFLAINTLKHTSDQALASRLDTMSQQAEENLSLKVALQGGGVSLVVNNTGGTSSTLESVFLTGPTGKNITDYLVGSPGLSLRLPTSLGPGASSGSISIPGASIKGSTSAFLISVLTQLGNVFSVQYPTPSQTLKNIIVLNQNIVDQIDQGNTVVDQNNQNVIVGCFACSVNLNGGGDILLVQISATPSPTQSGGTITVAGTVYNYSPYTASSANLTLTAYYAGAASVLPDISSTPMQCGTTTSILSNSSVPFSCVFTAQSSSGATGGTVTFSGTATACVLTNKTTDCPGGTIVNSAATSSNPVQIGTVVSYGPWQLNYYFFTYTDKTHQTSSSPAIITHSDTYVALSVQLTNIFNSSMTLLDGSYLQFVSPGSDVNAYMVENNTVSYTTNSFTAYGCVDSPPGAPTDGVSGQQCITVSPGQTITLVFAASAPAGTSWEWGSGGNPGGDSNVGCTVQIIIEYDLPQGGVNAIYAENIPFQSVFIQ